MGRQLDHHGGPVSGKRVLSSYTDSLTAPLHDFSSIGDYQYAAGTSPLGILS
ncbi:MAG: hypothetical protein AB8B91_04680 [Rubripirellula sp.]